MSASYPAPAGSDAELREFIGEALDGASRIAGAGVTFADMGLDDSLDRAVRQLTAFTRAAVSTLADLKAKQAERARRQEREAA